MSTGPQDLLFTVRQSSIHNRGVFAARDIRKGERIVEYAGERITKAESRRRALAQLDVASRTGNGAVYLFALNKKFDLDGSMEWNVARLINHSCHPNCEAVIIRGRIWIIACRKIKKGAELSFDYGFDLDSWEDHPCRCGTPECPGYIVAGRFRSKLRRLIAERDAAFTEIRAAASRRKPDKHPPTGTPR
jgi:SET domain-containing protein